MLNLGFTEILIIVILTIVVVGPEDIPKMMRYLGKQYGRIVRASDELRRAFMLEAEREETEKRAEELRKRREEARKRAEELRAKAAAAKPGAAETPVPRGAGLPEPPPPAAEPPAPVAEPVEALGAEKAPEKAPVTGVDVSPEGSDEARS